MPAANPLQMQPTPRTEERARSMDCPSRATGSSRAAGVASQNAISPESGLKFQVDDNHGL